MFLAHERIDQSGKELLYNEAIIESVVMRCFVT